MHTHTYIQCTREAEMKFSCIIENAKKERNEVYVDGGCAMAIVSI
jgi:hypothetical protein